LETKLFLVRHGVTQWHAEKRVLGRRDIPLSEAGIIQARRAAETVAGLPVREILSSPLQRAVQSAELIAAKVGIPVARDPRLTEFELGALSGASYSDIAANPDYQRYLEDPQSERIPGGESLSAIRDRSVEAIEQALSENPSGDTVVVVTHASVIRVLLAHYLGAAPTNYHRIRVAPGSISVLSFATERELPRVIAVNHCASILDALA
jgi:broad specificity phosphatase PhoE